MKDLFDKYNAAKEAYYNGHPIMTDYEFDELEEDLGLSNKSYVGTKHNPSYTVEHPFFMGSLSKVQIHEKDGVVDWSTYYEEAAKYFHRNCDDESDMIITPKYDGCSFEAVIKHGKVVSISSRGDGGYGKDLYKHLESHIKDAIKEVTLGGEFVLRGEVLINKNIFERTYSEFVNPRSFVSGLLNRDFDNTDEWFVEAIRNLSIVVYNVYIKNGDVWEDNDWTVFKLSEYTGYGYILDKYLPKHYYEESIDGPVDFENIYNDFSKYRETCPYALDGIVIKPVMHLRKTDLLENRPKDCIAIKFVPMLQETEVIDIEWNLGKTGEYTPVVITKPVIMDGKSVSRASGSNYGILLQKNISVGSRVILSLAGDIIPFVYKVTNTDAFSEEALYETLPNNTYVVDGHLMALLSDEELAKLKFIESGNTLKIPGLGEAELHNVWYSLTKDNGETDDFFGESNEEKKLPNNILFVTPEDIHFAITDNTVSKSTTKANKIEKAYKEVLRNISLKDIVKCCNFRFCGEKVAEQVANYLIGVPYSFEHLANEGYAWVEDKNSEQYMQVSEILSHLGKSFDDFKPRQEEIERINNQIPVILTGEPNDYKSKGEFLKCHPEYRLTSKWTEVKIVFTNDLESNTGKMKKAKEKNIEIRLY